MSRYLVGEWRVESNEIVSESVVLTCEVGSGKWEVEQFLQLYKSPIIHVLSPSHLFPLRITHTFTLAPPSSLSSSSLSSSSSAPIRRRRTRTSSPRNLNLKRLTSRIVHLTRRRQLHQIMEEIEVAKRRYGKLNTIVMNAVLEACVHCGDVDSARKLFDEMSSPEGCGVDTVTYGTLLKVLGKSGRIDEAFQLLESLQQGTAVGSPKLSPQLIFGLLNALVEAGELRRASGLLARHGFLLREGGSFSVTVYNLLMKGYISTGSPQGALTLHEEMISLGLQPDKLTYNTLISACVKAEKLDAALHFFKEMKDNAQKYGHGVFSPDVVTYTTLLKGFGRAMNFIFVNKIVMEMKTDLDLWIDRTAYTAIVDALLNCASIKGALCIFGEILKLASWNPDFRPKPHLYLSLMRAFAVSGDYDMVNSLHRRMWPDTAGTIRATIQEADQLLMEAALNSGQIHLAIQHCTNIIAKWKRISWRSRGGMVVLRIEAMMGITKSTLSPILLPQIWPGERIQNLMLPFEVARPLHGSLNLKKVARRFFREQVVPIIDDLGDCIGLLHPEDCIELDAPLWTLMRSPPPCVTTTTSIGHVINLMLEKRHRMVIVVNSHDLNEAVGSFRAIGIFTSEQLSAAIKTDSKVPNYKVSICKYSD